MYRRLGQGRGFSFVELLVVTSIILVLGRRGDAAGADHDRSASGRSSCGVALREIRTAIDKYKDAVDQGQIGGTDNQLGNEGYPPDLETLVEGVTAAGDASARKLKFLRRIPVDPMTRSTEWGLRSYQDAPDARSWGGKNVFDVYIAERGHRARWDEIP